MSAEILLASPVSGECLEISFGEHFRSPLWVRFTDNHFQEWAGCFSKAHEKALTLVLTDEGNKTGFVVAGGQGYLLDIAQKKLILQLEDAPVIESAIRTNQPDYFVAGTSHSIYLLNETGLVKEIEPEIIIDGIYFKQQQDSKAIGELATAENQYEENVEFEFDLASFELQLRTKKKKGLWGWLGL